jgi:hypothetical protein
MGKVINGKTEEQINAERLEANETQIAALTQYQSIAAVADVFTLDLQNSPYKNFASSTADATAKTVTVANIPAGRCEFVWELTYTEAAAITWFSGITWQGGSAPSLTAGKTYAFLFQTSNGGTAWRGTSVEW